jgi:hypothetical protein
MGDNGKVSFSDFLKYCKYILHNCQHIYARYAVQNMESFKLDSSAVILHQLPMWKNYFCLAFNDI